MDRCAGDRSRGPAAGEAAMVSESSKKIVLKKKSGDTKEGEPVNCSSVADPVHRHWEALEFWFDGDTGVRNVDHSR